LWYLWIIKQKYGFLKNPSTLSLRGVFLISSAEKRISSDKFAKYVCAVCRRRLAGRECGPRADLGEQTGFWLLKATHESTLR
jgi:hypothetical protein